MSYVPTGQFTKEHRQALQVTPEELAALTPQERADLTLRIAEAKSSKWETVATILTGAIPVITFLGLERLFRK